MVETITIEQQITGILADQLVWTDDFVTPESHLIADLRAGWCDFYKISQKLATTFNIDIPEDRFDQCETVQDIFNLVNDLITEKGQKK